MLREGVGPRIGAGLIDGIAVNALSVPLLLIVVKNVFLGMLWALLIPCTDGHSQHDSDQAMRSAAIALGGVSLIVVAYSALEVLFAASPGKLLLKLRIRSANGEPAQLSQLAGRWAIKYAWVLPYLLVVGILISGRNEPALVQILLWTARIVAVLVLIGFLRCGSANRLAFYDTLAGTAVYRIDVHPADPDDEDISD